MPQRKFAIVTGASSGIGLEIAKIAAADGYDLLICADEPLVDASSAIKTGEIEVRSVEADLATEQGVKRLLEAAGDRPVDVLVANAGRDLGHAFLDQATADYMRVVDTNITGTLLIVHPVAQAMVKRGEGRILITGSIAGHLAGAFNAVYTGTKAFLNTFAAALGNELKDSGVTITTLKPGATDTEIFHRADMDDTKVGQSESKADPADVAKAGWEGMLDGEHSVIPGVKNKLIVAASGALSQAQTAKLHRKQAEPGGGKKAN